MAAIIKNQVLKHLQRYVKKLSSDKINVSTFKGEGELNDLDLDEDVLTELLALPIWMKIKRAHCNRARLQISWTKLKNVPIRLVVDTIEIEIEACEELRPVVPTPQNAHLSVPSAGKYGFVNKVIDGITVTIESVEIRFFSKAFESKVQISRIVVESKSPQWKKVDLSQTRLKDMEKGEVLVFKEIEWQTLRLEAQSTKEKHLAPLRLLTNQAKARIVIKKKLNDCSVVGCRLSLILDDLLWVLTDSQILAAVHFMSSLSGLVKQATEMVQAVKAARKLESLPEYQAQQVQSGAGNERVPHSDAARVFDAFDVKETSYHLMCEKIDLHFCDDPGTGRSCHPDLRDGGAGQVQLTHLMVDFYPYHLAKTDRRHWSRYYNSDLNHWLKDALSTFQTQLLNLFPRSTGGSNINSPMESSYSSSSSPTSSARKPSATAADVVASRLSDQLSKLMSTCLVVKIRDICVYKVTTSSRESPKPFVSSYLERPKDIVALNMELTWFYYPGGISFPLPSTKIYTQVHPLQINLDVCTILWLNSFFTNIQNSMPQTQTSSEEDYVDIRLELVMPKVVFEEKSIHPPHQERPNALQIQASRVIVSNYRSTETGTRNQLATVIEEIERLGGINKTTDASRIPLKLLLHSKGMDKLRERKGSSDSHQLTPDALWTEVRDVWCITVDTVWADFCVDPRVKCENGMDNASKKKFRSNTMTSQSDYLIVPFIDSLPVSLWLYVQEELIDPEFSLGKRKDIQALLHADGMCNVQLTHQQYLFLLRAAEAISEISLFLTMDTRKTYIVSRKDDTVSLLGCIPRIELSLVLPCLDNTVEFKRHGSSLDEMEETLELEGLTVTSMQQQLELQIAPQWGQQEGKSIKPKSQSTADLSSISPEKFYSDLQDTASPSLNSVDGFHLKPTSLSQGMKQGISNLVVSFSKAQGGQSTPDSEVTSLWSTDSSENNFITLDPDQDALDFGSDDVQEAVEVAEEVIEDNSQSTGSFSIHNPYGKEDTVEINTLTVALNGLKISQRSEGLSSGISLGCKTLTVDESSQIAWKDFQTLFATRSKKWRTDNERVNSKTEERNAICVNFTQKIDDATFMNFLSSQEMTDALKAVKGTKCPRVNMMDMAGPDSPIRKAISKSTHPNVKVDVDLSQGKANHGQCISLTSNICKLAAEFFEDEIPPSVLPMTISVGGADVELTDDKGPDFPPTRVVLEKTVQVVRKEDGVIRISCPCEPTKTAERGLCNGDRAGENVGGDIQESGFKEETLRLRQELAELQKERKYLLSQLEKAKSSHV